MRILAACVTGFLLDLMLGDPRWLYHPVRMIGALITFLEKILRKMAGEDERRLLAAGGILVLLVVFASTLVPFLILKAAAYVTPAAAYIVESFMCYQLLAVKSLRVESRKVYDRLVADDLTGARKAVSMIVGRDTQSLNEEGVTKAAVETVAENTSDGIIAPLLYMMAGGAVLSFLYKAVNTMDSMVGYKNEKYLYFGRAAAKMDDLLNYLPARVSAMLMIAASFLLRMDAKGAARIYVRDRKNHKSPNAAQTEAVCAGALRVQLAGNAYYFGKLYEKETIGDPIRPVEAEDIKRAGNLALVTAVLTVLLTGTMRAVWLLLF